MMMINAVMGCAGEAFSDGEAGVIRAYRPAGLILFKRNCISPEQVRRLTDSYFELMGTDKVIVMIDEEGGKVRRMTTPVWPEHPPMADFGALYVKQPERAVDLLKQNCQVIALKLREAGINTVAAPVLDLQIAGASDVIGTRAFSADGEVVSVLGRIVCETFMACGILPIIKHMPGHGRAPEDTHLKIARIDAPLSLLEATDFVPFRRLSGMPLGMMAHVITEALDPKLPASVSPVVYRYVRTELNFKGLLMSDCIHMEGLPGTLPEKARQVIDAGCDFVLNSHGTPEEMSTVADACRPLTRMQADTLEHLLNTVCTAPPPAIADYRALADSVRMSLSDCLRN